MIPKKPQKLIKQVAEELDLPLSTVDNIITFYYKEIRKNLSSLEHTKINLIGLGDFVMLNNAVNKLISKHTNLTKSYNRDTFKNYHNLKVSEGKLEKLTKAKEKINEFVEAKKKFKDERKSKKDMEEQETDNGGN